MALCVARFHGVDLHAVGDGNPGAWNALEQLGARRAWPAFVGDGLKGFLAGLIGLLARRHRASPYVAVAAAMLGHCFPMFADFKGGKAVMTFAGGAFALSPPAALVSLLACALVSFVTGGFKWGARVGVFCFPVVQLFFDPVGRVIATGALMSIIGLRYLFALRRGRRAPPAPGRPDHGEREPRRGGGVAQWRQPVGGAAALEGARQRGQQREPDDEQQHVQPAAAPKQQARERRRHARPHDGKVERQPRPGGDVAERERATPLPPQLACGGVHAHRDQVAAVAGSAAASRRRRERAGQGDVIGHVAGRAREAAGSTSRSRSKAEALAVGHDAVRWRIRARRTDRAER